MFCIKTHNAKSKKGVMHSYRMTGNCHWIRNNLLTTVVVQ